MLRSLVNIDPVNMLATGLLITLHDQQMVVIQPEHRAGAVMKMPGAVQPGRKVSDPDGALHGTGQIVAIGQKRVGPIGDGWTEHIQIFAIGFLINIQVNLLRRGHGPMSATENRIVQPLLFPVVIEKLPFCYRPGLIILLNARENFAVECLLNRLTCGHMVVFVGRFCLEVVENV